MSSAGDQVEAYLRVVRVQMDAIGASLDHAVWLHHPIRFDDWLLYSSVSPIAQDARGLIFGAVYTRDGVQLASVAQEALIRDPRRR